MRTPLPLLAALAACAASPDGRAFDGAKFEPPDGRVYSGVGQDMGAYGALLIAAEPGRQPMLVSEYDGIGYGPDRPPALGVLRATQMAPGCILEIGYDLPWKDDALLERVVNGAYDHALRRSARAYRGLTTPVLLRVGYEFDLEWTGYRPDLYRAAFRRLVGIFREERADNVAFLWCASTSNHVGKLLDWYPGDDVVDWWSFNAWGPIDAADYLSEAARHHKPVLVGEFSLAFWRGGPLAKWYQPSFDALRRSGVKGYQYINFNWPVIDDWKQFRENAVLTDDPALVARHLEEMRKPEYLHRDARHFQPNALIVNAARNAFPADDGGDWSPRMDQSAALPGYGYGVPGARLYRDRSGWLKGWRSRPGARGLSVELTVPAGSAGYACVSLGSTGPLLFHLGGKPVPGATQPGRLVDREFHPGFLKLRYGPGDTRDGRLVLGIANADGGTEPVCVMDLSIQLVSPGAPPAPGGLRLAGAPSPSLAWTPVEGADRYDVYRDGALVGSTAEPRYSDLEAPAGTHRYSVSSWSRSLGEGWISTAVEPALR